MTVPDCVKSCLVGMSVLAVVTVAPMAAADTTECVLEILATNGTTSGTFAVPYDPACWDGDTYFWELEGTVDIMDGATVVGTIGDVDGLLPTTITYVDDPEVHINFVMTAGTTDTVFTVTSTHMTFPTIGNALAKSEVGINLSDRNGDGALLTAVDPHTGVSFSHYNGLAPGGTMFSELLDTDMVVSEWGSLAAGDDTGGFQPIGEPISSMSAQIQFQVSAGDLASGSSTFIVVPEPSALLMLAAGLALLRRR